MAAHGPMALVRPRPGHLLDTMTGCVDGKNQWPAAYLLSKNRARKRSALRPALAIHTASSELDERTETEALIFRSDP